MTITYLGKASACNAVVLRQLGERFFPNPLMQFSSCYSAPLHGLTFRPLPSVTINLGDASFDR